MTDTKENAQAGDASKELVTPEEHAQVIERDKDGAVLRGFDPELVGTPVDKGVPSLPNDEETAARSADMDTASTEHRKVFVLGPGTYDKASGYDHEANYAATRQGAINAGLWPVGDVRFVSNKVHPDGKSRVLSYAVEVEPAHDIKPGATHPQVVGDDTDNEGASKADNAEPSADEPTA